MRASKVFKKNTLSNTKPAAEMAKTKTDGEN